MMRTIVLIVGHGVERVHMGTLIEIPAAMTGNGYLALPESGTGPGVVVLHAWWGRNAVITDFCDRLAAEGFVVLAPDLYDGRVVSAIEEADAVAGALDHGAAMASTSAAIATLSRNRVVTGEGVAVVGFSLGAAFALSATTTLAEHVRAAIVFYGTWVGLPFEQAHAAFQGHFAEVDAFEPAEQVRELETSLQKAGHVVDFHVYPSTGHWFMEPDRPEYNSIAASLAWDRTISFLRTHLATRTS